MNRIASLYSHITNCLTIGLISALVSISTLSFSQSSILKGRVEDQKGQAIGGAIITNPKTVIASISRKTGEFTFAISSTDSTLVVKKSGYYDHEIVLAGENNITVVLNRIEKLCFEDTVRLTMGGFGKWDETNSSNSISHLLLERYHRSAKSLADILAVLPGLNVKKDNGQPGAGMSILSRGYESLVADEPLVLVDGVALNTGVNMPGIATGLSALSVINVKNIKRIEVLRDAASAAIFGSRGANGVIIIETIKGANNSFEIKNHTQFGIHFPIVGKDMMQSAPYSALINESLMAASLNQIEFPEDLSDKDWQNDILGTGMSVNHTISLLGGGDKSKYNLSGNINYDNGVLKKSNLLDGGIYFNYSKSMAKWFDLAFNVSYSKVVQHSPINNSSEFASNPYVYARAYPPLSAEQVQSIPELSQSYGSINPLDLINRQTDKNNASFLKGGLDLTFNLSEHLSFHSIFSGDFSFFNNKASVLSTMDNDWNFSNEIRNSQESTLYNLEMNNYLRFQRINTKSNWLFLLGADQIYLDAQNSIKSTLWEGASSPLDVEGVSWRKVSALYTKLMYSCYDRFDFSASFRREKVLNRGGKDNFGLFPAFSSGVWLKKNEQKNDELFSGMKLFMGFGILGANRFSQLSYSSVNADGQYVDNLSNVPEIDPNADWENVQEWNFGFKTSWFQDALGFSLTYFDRTRDNVAYLSTETENELSISKWNYTGEVYNSGYELELDLKKNYNDFGLFAQFNIQLNRSEVVGMGESKEGTIGYNSGMYSPFTVFKEGSTPGVFWGYLNDGVKEGATLGDEIPAAGDYNFRDIDGNGLINENDKTVIGNPTPDIHYVFNGGIVFENVDLSFVLDGNSGGDILNVEKGITESTGGYNNRSVSMGNRWTEENPSGSLARACFTDPNNNSRLHSGMIEDASFFRLNRIELGYSFMFANSTRSRVYFSVSNLVLFSSYSEGSPVFNGMNNNRGVSYGLSPFSSSILLGLQVGL